MPDFWQFPTVSMGLGPLMAIYQARFLKYLKDRGLADTETRKVWAFLGDGEMDEPESLGAIGLAARENLDNLIFVVNCNLQRLDGPVRGNGKIIQELEGEFRGAGWNVIKADLGQRLGSAAGARHRRRAAQAHDGNASTASTRTTRPTAAPTSASTSSASDPEPLPLVANISDDDIWRLHRGGHDPHKVYAAYRRGREPPRAGRPCILAKTVKGLRHGRPPAKARNTAHQAKKLPRRGHPAPSATASTSRSGRASCADSCRSSSPADGTPEMST